MFQGMDLCLRLLFSFMHNITQGAGGLGDCKVDVFVVGLIRGVTPFEVACMAVARTDDVVITALEWTLVG